MSTFFVTLLLLAAVMTYLTYTPSDPRYFWMYWCTIIVFLFFGYLMSALFGDEMSFVFDPNPDVSKIK